jgi:hypothetical protein
MEKEKLSRIKMIYGYAVCLVAVITFLITVTSMVYSLIDLTDPINAHRTYGKDAPSLASYDNYKMDIIKSLSKEQSVELDDTTLQSMYNAAKQDAISKVKHDAYRSVIVNGLIIIVCVVLFITHWIWMRRLSKRFS